MAAQIIILSKIGNLNTQIGIKINDGITVPPMLLTDSIQSFRTWVIGDDHIFIWTNAQGREVFAVIPHAHIGWIVSARPIGTLGDRFCIDAPCETTIMDE